MKILVISDVHGNLPALEYVLSKEKDSDLVISLGDVVNYGPWSNACVDLLNALSKKVLIKGNHEDAFMNGAYPGPNEIVNAFFNFCYPKFERKYIIEKYLDHFEINEFYFRHTINDAYIFQDSEVQIKENCFIGHSHRIFEREINGFKLINVGSVGQNRANIDEINYAVWYPEEKRTELKVEKYSSDKLLNEMKKEGYPEICLNYLMSKRK